MSEQLKEPIFTAELSSFSESSEINFAISSAADACRDTDGVTLLILNRHLKALCELQLSKLSGLD